MRHIGIVGITEGHDRQRVHGVGVVVLRITPIPWFIARFSLPPHVSRPLDQRVDVVPCGIVLSRLVCRIPVGQDRVEDLPGDVDEVLVGADAQLCYYDAERVPLYEASEEPLPVTDSVVRCESV